MGLTTLGDATQVTLTSTLSVMQGVSGGNLVWRVDGAEVARVYFQATGGSKQLVADGPGGTLNNEGLPWVTPALSGVFTLVPVTKGIEGPGLLAVQVPGGSPTGGTLTTPAWYPTTAPTNPPPSGSTPPPAGTDALSFLDALPGGRYPWLVGAGLGIVMLFKRGGK